MGRAGTGRGRGRAGARMSRPVRTALGLAWVLALSVAPAVVAAQGSRSGWAVSSAGSVSRAILGVWSSQREGWAVEILEAPHGAYVVVASRFMATGFYHGGALVALVRSADDRSGDAARLGILRLRMESPDQLEAEFSDGL